MCLRRSLLAFQTVDPQIVFEVAVTAGKFCLPWDVSQWGLHLRTQRRELSVRPVSHWGYYTWGYPSLYLMWSLLFLKWILNYFPSEFLYCKLCVMWSQDSISCCVCSWISWAAVVATLVVTVRCSRLWDWYNPIFLGPSLLSLLFSITMSGILAKWATHLSWCVVVQTMSGPH